MSFANIFSQYVAHLPLLDTLFCRPEVLKFNEVLLIVYFMNLAFGVIYKKSLLYPRSCRFYSLFSEFYRLAFYI